MTKQEEDFVWKDDWIPDIRATLMFVVKEGKILLIRKKTGIGQGKINGPGGKIELGETPLECALRETEEELCIRARNIKEMGELFFSFRCGTTPEIQGHVFMAGEFDGVPKETREAKPVWCDLDKIPYDEMWEDDRYWLPSMLEGRKFRARFIFEGEIIVSKSVEFFQDIEGE